MATFKSTFDSYAGAAGFLGERKGAKVGNNTQVIRRDADTIVVQFHATDVVTYKRNGTVKLDNGGWKTNTTRERLRLFSPVDVRQYSGQERWIVGDVSREFNGQLTLSPKVVAAARQGVAL